MTARNARVRDFAHVIPGLEGERRPAALDLHRRYALEVWVGPEVGGQSVAVAQRAALAVLEPLLADPTAADVEVPNFLPHAAETGGLHLVYAHGVARPGDLLDHGVALPPIHSVMGWANLGDCSRCRAVSSPTSRVSARNRSRLPVSGRHGKSPFRNSK